MSVFANSRKITHKGSGQTETCAVPDVCKTPSPGGPIPIPYVNIAMDSQLAEGSTKTKIEGNPIALESSNISTSTGDEPGTAGGIMSSKFKGKMTWGSSSSDVIVEGKGVVRFMDVTQHNGNSFNCVFIEQGGTGFAYADDFKGECPICNASPEKHAVKEKVTAETSGEIVQRIMADLNAREDAFKEANKKVVDAQAELRRLLKSPIRAETVAVREGQIKALEAARDALPMDHRRESNGYMFGVMVCKCSQKWAAVSGGEMPPGFESIAGNHGCTPIKDAATVDDIKAINPRSATPAGAADIDAHWDAAMTKHTAGAKGYNNEPGTCAGAKLLGKSGHVAETMTEVYFAYKGGLSAQTFSVIYRGPADLAPGTSPWTAPTAADIAGKNLYEMEDERPMRRRVGTTVPSCKTCQDTLFMVRCDLKDKC